MIDGVTCHMLPQLSGSPLPLCKQALIMTVFKILTLRCKHVHVTLPFLKSFSHAKKLVRAFGSEETLETIKNGQLAKNRAKIFKQIAQQAFLFQRNMSVVI